MTTAEPPAAGCGDPYKRHPLTTPTPNYSAHLVKHRKALALSILDEGFYCHIGYFDPEANAVRVVPRQYGRSGDSLYIHGPGPAPGSHLGDEHTSRLYRLIAQNRVSDVCVTVSLVDGLALARSAAHAALSYRSVVIYGKACVVLDNSEDGEKAEALETIANHIAPGYADDSRKADAAERKAVGIIRIDFRHVSSKVRTGGPARDGKDPQEFWAGVVPIRPVYGPPISSKDVPSTVRVPGYVRRLTGIRGANDLDVAPPRHGEGEERPDGAPLF